MGDWRCFAWVLAILLVVSGFVSSRGSGGAVYVFA